MSRKRRSFTPDYKEEAAKLVIETSRPIAESARDIGINEQTLRNWAESFFAALKNERVHRTQYPTREHARKDLVRYIDFRYNTRRLHSALGYRTPQEVHKRVPRPQRSSVNRCLELSGKCGADHLGRSRGRLSPQSPPR